MSPSLAGTGAVEGRKPLLVTSDLKKHFSKKSWLLGRRVSLVKAVDGVSLSIWPGESVGLVGETGSGKSTFGRCVLRILEPSQGEIYFDGNPIGHLEARDLQPYRARMQMVFQNPYSSLDPRMRIRTIIAEPLLIRKQDSPSAIEARVRELMTLVGIEWDFAYRLPHELSGGQRQRIAIARALAVHPEFLVLDEPTSALDVSVQAQVLNLLVELQKTLGLTYLFISHDLGVIRYMCDRIAIMYQGRLVEIGRTDEIFEDARHPYTKALLSSVLEPDPDQQVRESVFAGNGEGRTAELLRLSETHFVAPSES